VCVVHDNNRNAGRLSLGWESGGFGGVGGRGNPPLGSAAIDKCQW